VVVKIALAVVVAVVLLVVLTVARKVLVALLVTASSRTGSGGISTDISDRSLRIHMAVECLI
jgi:hypothetical protein